MASRSLLAVLMVAALPLAACQDKATLDRSRVEMMTLEGRKFEVRIAATERDEVRRQSLFRWSILPDRGVV